ncbi:MAG: alpha-2-macroglobulin family protein, partial [Campylobacteraceae bacterium]|nr:alpha-2-macroglobulin family protein [Campylobacteraceae bacterium]
VVGFASSSSLLPSDFTEGIAVTTLNIQEVDIDFFLINLQSLPQALNTLFKRTSSYTYSIDDLLKNNTKPIYSGRFTLNAKKNVRETVTLPIKNIKELKNNGIYMAVMKQTGKYYAYNLPVTIFAVTDIGVIVHKNKNGYDIFTQNLTGKIMPHVNIKLINEQGKVTAETQTDNKGYLNLNHTLNTAVLLAQKNGKISFVYLDRGALDLADFGISGAKNFDKTLFAFGPRDLYRSGESVIVNAILRNSDGKRVPQQPIKVDILQADNKIAKTFTWQDNDGLYQYTYELPQNAPAGNWRFRFDLGDGNYRFYDFKVEDFMPEKMALEINKNDKPSDKTSNVVFDVYGKYLYGAPASGNKLIGDLKTRALRNALSTMPGFYFGSVRENDLDRYIGYVDTTLDDNGKASITAQNSWNHISSPINIVLEASLMESGGRPVTRTVTQAVWPNKELPAIKPNFGMKKIYNYKNNRYENEFSIDENSHAEFEIVFTNKDAEKLAKNNLRVNLIKERYDYYWYYNDMGWGYDYDIKYIGMESVDVSIREGKSATVGFDVEWGSYIVEVIDKDTNVISSVRFFAGYSWQNSNKGETRPEQIKLKTDKLSYKAGDTAKITIDSIENGSGYLIVETNEGILWWQNIHVNKNSEVIEIPISKEWTRHDIYISATIIKEGNKNLHLTPKRAMGLLHLPLFRDDRKIDITLKVPEKIEPKKKVKVSLKVNSNQKQKGKKFTAIVSAVDSGILNITDFQTPDPFGVFFAKKELGIDIYDVYGNLIEGGGKSASLKFGGDAALSKAMGGKKPLTEISLVSMQSKPVTINENSEAEVEFDIPDFNGELRFMAQIWGDEDYGSGEQKAIVAAPLVVELNHPRFLAGGDKSALALDINNLSGLEQSLKVSVSAMGYLDGFTEEQFKISDKQKKVIYIPISAKSGFGSGTVAVKITGIEGQSEKNIEKKWTIGVRAPYPASAFKLFKELTKDSVIKSNDFEDGYNKLDERTIEASIAISSLPPINFAQAIKELFAYPYGCVEQTTSGIYPSIYISSEQLEALGIKTSNNEERKRNVEKGIERLLGMQKPNGSFGFWSSEDSEAHWATVYVTDFLLRAKEQGYYVPQEALKNAIGRLQYYTNSGNIDYGYSYDLNYINFAVKSYAALVLAREQKANLGNLRRLYDLANHNQSTLALTQLGIALKLMGDNERSDEILTKALSFGVKRENYHWYGDYGSNLRDTALTLSLLYEHNLFPNSRAGIILSLSEQIKSKRYFSTQERNAIFLAGRHIINSKEPAWQAVIDANGKKEDIKTGDKSFVRALDFTALNAIQSIKNNGDTNIFTSIDITGYPKSAPTPVANNITIERTYYTLEGKNTSLSELKSGDLIIVALHVTTELARVSDALVVDLLPAGLELENQNLGHSAVSLADSDAIKANKELAHALAKTSIVHQEFRDDRYMAAIDIGRYEPATLVYLARAVSPGIYTVPPPYVESMYNPEIFAIGKSALKLTVK